MRLRLTIDDQLVVHDAGAEMLNTPFPECVEATAPFGALVGARIGKGWRRTVAECMGGVEGCTHLREMLSVLATVALQATNGYKRRRLQEEGRPLYNMTKPGNQMGKCLGWDFNGPVVSRVAPQFTGYVEGEKR